MRLLVIFIITSISLVQATNSYAQKTTVSLDVRNQTVKEVLDEIEDQSEFTFFFNNRHLDLQRRVSVSEKKSDIFNFIHDYMVTISLIISGDIDVNYINAKIAYLEKHGHKPEWIPTSQGNYRTSPNNPSKLYFW